MVGTAVNQVGRHSFNQPKKFSRLKPGLQTTLAPAVSDAMTAAIRPCMWNSGMMFKQTSSQVSASVVAILHAEVQILPWVRGTSLGREVVPEVCKTRASSSVVE